MNDFVLIRSNKKKQFNFQRPVNNPGLKKYQYRIGEIFIDSVSLQNEDQFMYETDDSIFLLLGDVFHPESHKEQFKRITIKEIALDKLYLVNPAETLRGYFIILKIDKKTQSVTLINDIFGIIPVYYGELDEAFVISTSLSILNVMDFELNETVLAEKILFQHSLTNETLIKNIEYLEPASILYLNNTFRVKKYYAWYEFFKPDEIEPFDIKKYIHAFNKIILNRSTRDYTNLVTLTGGHDGRAVLSGFIKNNINFETFSFGRSGSENTKIPEIIAQKLHFNHHSIYLEDDFEKEYFNNALETLWLSDGELSFEQQSTLYAVKQMAPDYTINFTGLIAGEILGPVHLITDYITPLYYKYIYLKQPVDLNDALKKLGIKDYINYSFIESHKNSIEKHINYRIDFNNGVNQSNVHLKYLFDLIQFGFRKFYGYQMHLMLNYIRNIPVFYDFDLLSYLIHSDYNKIYKYSFKNKLSKFNSRKVQCSIIANNSSELSKIVLDRGYPPYWSIHPILKYFRIIPYKRRKKRLKNGLIPRDFISEKWSKNIYNEDFFETLSHSSVFNNKEIIKYLRSLNEDSSTYDFETNRIISLLIYVQRILKK